MDESFVSDLPPTEEWEHEIDDNRRKRKLEELTAKMDLVKNERELHADNMKDHVMELTKVYHLLQKTATRRRRK